MHGDIALCEALGSLPAFFRLTALGIPFPHDRYGAYVGYKTDHDPRQRATSAGPLTSRLMVEALAREVKKARIPLLEGHPGRRLDPEGRKRERGESSERSPSTGTDPAGKIAAWSCSTRSTSSWARAVRPGSTRLPFTLKANADRTDWPLKSAPPAAT